MSYSLTAPSNAWYLNAGFCTWHICTSMMMGWGGANGQTGGVDSALKLAKQATKGYNSGVRGQSKPFCLFAIL